jgi:UDP-N-acetylglucosamine diphosphorylase / glucose-1-phosphate thymidylyltransferase / UDP-N-acetylgalactosamine diphosphorylase / glucosamine-1-phosphate N-acetyltransferase / galactosamine-1-phosphate N-acetyltransferase
MTTPTFVILAGGEGKRFAPFVTNKTMFPFLGKPLLQHQLEQLARVGATNVLIATNENNQAWLDTFSHPGLSIKTKAQPQPLGMADAVLNLADQLQDQPIVIMNAVDVVDDQLFITLLAEIEKQPYGLITGMKVNSYFPGGYLRLENHKVVEVVEKPAPGNEPSDLVNLVFHYFSHPQEFIERLKNTTSSDDDVYEKALTQLFQEHDFGVVEYQSYWQKLKYPHFVLDMTELFLNNRLEESISKSAQISPQATIQGPVFIGDNAIVDPGAVIVGPAYIGDNSRVGNHTLVRHSIVESNAVVGFGSEVARSYIGPKTMLHHNFIGDSVLEGDVNPSYGTATTNWRLDKKPVKLKSEQGLIDTGRDKLGAVIAQGAFIGANSTIMPGITIGANARVYPNSVIHRAIPANSTLKSTQHQETQEN